MSGKTPLLKTVATERIELEASSYGVRKRKLDLQVGMMMQGRYKILKKVDKDFDRGGESEDIYLCEDSQMSGEKVVVKIYRSTIDPPKLVLEKLKGLEHPDILRYVDYGELDVDDKRFFEVSEYASGGSLTGRTFTEAYIIEHLLPEILNAFKYFHDLGIVHRDIKPENLFFRDKNQTDLVIGDFGLSSAFDSGISITIMNVKGFSPLYDPPELLPVYIPEEKRYEKEITILSLIQEMHISTKVDYYQLGITLIELLSGVHPLKGHKPEQIIYMKQQGNIPLPIGCSKKFEKLLRGLLHPIHGKRWGLEQVKQWLAGEPVEVLEYEEATSVFRYKFTENLTAHNLEDLAKFFLDNPGLAQEHIERNILGHYLELHDQSLALSIHKIIGQLNSPYNTLLEIIYTLDSNLPYRFLPGDEALSPEELARLIDRDEKTTYEGKRQLYNGNILTWLRTIGRKQIEDSEKNMRVDNINRILDQWAKVSNSYASKKDQGLEYFLHLLDPGLEYPNIEVEPSRLDFGRVEEGTQRRLKLSIRKLGRGILNGHISTGNVKGLSIEPEQFEGDGTEITVTFNAREHPVGRSLHQTIVIRSNAQRNEIRVPVLTKVGYPIWSNLVGAAKRTFSATSNLFEILLERGIITSVLILVLLVLLQPFIELFLDEYVAKTDLFSKSLWHPDFTYQGGSLLYGLYFILIGVLKLILVLIWGLILILLGLALLCIYYLNHYYVLQCIITLIAFRLTRARISERRWSIGNLREQSLFLSIIIGLILLASLIMEMKAGRTIAQHTQSDFKIPAGWVLIFQDNFSGTSISNNWEVKKGDWKIETGTLRGRAIRNKHGMIISLRRPIIGDMAIEFDARTTNEKYGFDCSITSGDDSEKGYILALGAPLSEDSWGSAILRNDEVVMQNNDLNLIPKKDYHVIFVRESSTVSAYINGQEFLHYTDHSPIDMRTHSFANFGSYLGVHAVYFDNIKIYGAGSTTSESTVGEPLEKPLPPSRTQPPVVKEPRVPPKIYPEKWIAKVYVIDVSAVEEGVTTGAHVNAGDSIKINVKKITDIQWDGNLRDGESSGPKGSSFIANSLENGSMFILPSAPAGCLVGKIGQSGKWFYVGEEKDILAQGNGTLYLSVNDRRGEFNDNFGLWVAQVIIKSPSKS